METIRAYAWYSAYSGPHGAGPPRAAVQLMLAELEKELTSRRSRAVALSCERWPARMFQRDDARDHLGCIAIMIEPGDQVRPLTSWFQWQHPQWRIAENAPPALERPALHIHERKS